MTFPGKAQFRALLTATIAIYLMLLAIVQLHLVPYAHEIEVAVHGTTIKRYFPTLSDWAGKSPT